VTRNHESFFKSLKFLQNWRDAALMAIKHDPSQRYDPRARRIVSPPASACAFSSALFSLPV